MKKSNIGAIIRKEFNRFFTDRRLVMTAIILPGLMIYLLYSFMGSAMSDMYSVEDDFAPTVYAVNAPGLHRRAGAGSRHNAYRRFPAGGGGRARADRG